jgi:hypothetical protein
VACSKPYNATRAPTPLRPGMWRGRVGELVPMAVVKLRNRILHRRCVRIGQKLPYKSSRFGLGNAALGDGLRPRVGGAVHPAHFRAKQRLVMALPPERFDMAVHCLRSTAHLQGDSAREERRKGFTLTWG